MGLHGAAANGALITEAPVDHSPFREGRVWHEMRDRAGENDRAGEGRGRGDLDGGVWPGITGETGCVFEKRATVGVAIANCGKTRTLRRMVHSGALEEFGAFTDYRAGCPWHSDGYPCDFDSEGSDFGVCRRLRGQTGC